MQLSDSQKKYIRKYKINNLLVTLFQFLILFTFIFIWEYLSSKNIINSFIFSSPFKVYNCIKNLIINGELLIHISTTLYEVFIAFTLGILIGFIISILLYIFPIIYKIIEPFLTMLNSLPKVALGPILIIWFGANTKSIIVMALLINVIICIMNILNGFNNTEKIKIKMLKSLNATKYQILKYLVIPNSYNTIISSFKINISMTLIGVIMGEFLVSKKGIGYLIVYGSQIFNLDLVISGIVLLSIISFILYKFIVILEKLLIKS